MSETYYLADTHLAHSNIHKFRRKNDGSEFETAKEHDEFICDMWQTYITKHDTVVIAGDVAFNTTGLNKLKQLTGNKQVIVGNHDKSVQTLQEYVGWVGAMKMISVEGFHTIITHIPIHFIPLERWHLNIHGHTHASHVPGNKHFNISIEAINYIPITMEEILTQVTRNEWGVGK